jgi:paraquat-inducible protein A
MAEMSINCRRCGEPFTFETRAWLPACPACGAAAVPLRERFSSNRVAAVLAVLALVCLGVGLSTPFMTMEKLGDRNTFSLVGGVLELFDRGNVIIGSVLLIFSVIFPIMKLLALLAATSSHAPLTARWRKILHKAADLTGKYSMLDVMVIAVIIVLVKFKNLAHVEAHSGVIWFCGAVILSLVAGLCVRLEDVNVQHPTLNAQCPESS